MAKKPLFILALALALTLLPLVKPLNSQVAFSAPNDTITVDTTRDTRDAGECSAITIASLPGLDGKTSLREAICAANNNPGPDTIAFAIPLTDPGYNDIIKEWTIILDIALPPLSGGGTTIDGYTQTGSMPADDSGPADIRVALSGSLLANANGLNLISSNNTVKGLVIRNCPGNGIAVGVLYTGVPADGNTISGNHIGTNKNANADRGNGLDGVFIGLGARNTLVGGPNLADRNVISGNGAAGVEIHGADTQSNTITGNYIGTGGSGVSALPNDLDGVRIYGGAHDNLVGPRNLLSGNGRSGLRLAGPATIDNAVIGNNIGVSIWGIGSIPNDSGVVLTDGASYNRIGGWLEGNLISGNHTDGVLLSGAGVTGNIVSGNLIGVNGTGSIDMGNGSSGIALVDGPQNNTIGGDEAGERNLISGNDLDGITLMGADTAGNTISGNYIGLAADGESPVGNSYEGVLISAGAHENIIGPNNVISGNGDSGVVLSGSTTFSNTVARNLIGTSADGLVAVGNAAEGVRLNLHTYGNIIGPDNVISGNNLDGIGLYDTGTSGNEIRSNRIGTNASGAAALANGLNGVNLTPGAGENLIVLNLISGNDGSGIVVSSNDNAVQGNQIGLDETGSVALGNGSEGVHLSLGGSLNLIGGDQPAERNVISGNHDNGVTIYIGSGNVVSGNYIGTDSSGSSEVGNYGSGIQIRGGSTNNQIGGDTLGERNLISGNYHEGVLIEDAETTGNVVSGNYIGLDASGTLAVPNGFLGIFVSAPDNRIGGTAPGERNVISGNAEHGVMLSADDAHGNRVTGNYIGTNAAGTSPVGNTGAGIILNGLAHDNQIGGTSDGESNIVAGNGNSGIAVVHGSYGNTIQNNRVGTDAFGRLDLGNAGHGFDVLTGANGNTFGPENVVAYNGAAGFYLSGADTYGNSITQNRVFSNEDAGIWLNDGSNHGILAPIISTTEEGSVIISGSACSGCIVELFENRDEDGEGEVYLGTTAADGSGHFSIILPYLNYPYLTATATRPVDGTSEFSAVFTATYLGERYIYLPITVH